MSLLGIDVGSTGCKSAAFSEKRRVARFCVRRVRRQASPFGMGGARLFGSVEKVRETIRETVGIYRRRPRPGNPRHPPLAKRQFL